MVGKSADQLAKEHGATLRSLRWGTNQGGFPEAAVDVWTFKTPKSETRYAVFYAPTHYEVPGSSSASIFLLSPAGNEIGRWSFPIGWRSRMNSASTSFDESLKAQIVTVETAPLINGRDVAKQYFALVDDKFYFIRMEDSKGLLIRNNYLYPNHTLGGIAPAKDMAAWMSLLESSQLALRLAALTYLSGMHMNPDKPQTEILSESIDDAKTARAFTMANTAAKRIEDYRHSQVPGLKEAADLAAIPLAAGEYGLTH